MKSLSEQIALLDDLLPLYGFSGLGDYAHALTLKDLDERRADFLQSVNAKMSELRQAFPVKDLQVTKDGVATVEQAVGLLRRCLLAAHVPFDYQRGSLRLIPENLVLQSYIKEKMSETGQNLPAPLQGRPLKPMNYEKVIARVRELPTRTFYLNAASVVEGSQEASDLRVPAITDQVLPALSQSWRDVRVYVEPLAADGSLVTEAVKTYQGVYRVYARGTLVSCGRLADGPSVLPERVPVPADHLAPLRIQLYLPPVSSPVQRLRLRVEVDPVEFSASDRQKMEKRPTEIPWGVSPSGEHANKLRVADWLAVPLYSIPYEPIVRAPKVDPWTEFRDRVRPVEVAPHRGHELLSGDVSDGIKILVLDAGYDFVILPLQTAQSTCYEMRGKTVQSWIKMPSWSDALLDLHLRLPAGAPFVAWADSVEKGNSRLDLQFDPVATEEDGHTWYRCQTRALTSCLLLMLYLESHAAGAADLSDALISFRPVLFQQRQLLINGQMQIPSTGWPQWDVSYRSPNENKLA